ncbi:MAG: hypothetical protein H6709_13185 [Kofleriaceae bacterium]|nr:hypothetical protein [Myxococcales bacterium]MCB9573031.1 hypothetical protein [Kofleriaceae bacterium]
MAAAAAGLAGLAGCGPGLKGGGGRLRIQTSSGPVFDWDRCDAFGVKECGDKLKVSGLVIVPVDCTVGGTASGERPVMWSVQASGGFGAQLQPPITYGVAPAGGTADPAIELKTGCQYLASFTVYAQGTGSETLSESFQW